jgi:hypothetical protein
MLINIMMKPLKKVCKFLRNRFQKPQLNPNSELSNSDNSELENVLIKLLEEVKKEKNWDQIQVFLQTRNTNPKSLAIRKCIGEFRENSRSDRQSQSSDYFRAKISPKSPN